MRSTMCGTRDATKSLLKIQSALRLFKIRSDLSVYNYQQIIHAGYVEDLCVIPDSISEECAKMICSEKNTRK